MFGLIIAGRLLQTDVQQVDPTHFIFTVPQAEAANHIVVFLTGATPFPEGYAATVHFQWADNPDWKLLGLLSNEKPSAIFKLKGNIRAAQSGSSATAHIGIMCETLDVVQAQIATLSATANQSGALVPANQRTSGDNALHIAAQVAKNFLNYLSSFASNVPTHSSLHAILQEPSAQNALIAMCDRWYKGLESKTRNGIDWLNKEQD